MIECLPGLLTAVVFGFAMGLSWHHWTRREK